MGIDLSKALGYNDNDDSRRVVWTYVLGKYKMRLGDAQSILGREVDADTVLKEDMVLLKEPDLTLFNFLHQPPTNEPCNKSN